MATVFADKAGTITVEQQFREDAKKTDTKILEKVTIISNILERNIVPASQQKERDKEANAWKKRLFGFLSGIKDSLGNLAKGALKVAGKFPWIILLLLLKFLKQFMGPLKAALNALKGVAAWLKGLPLMIKGLIAGLKGARALLLDKLAKALKAFKEGPLMRRLAGIFNTIGRFVRNALGLAARGARGARFVGGILGALAGGLAAFLKGPLLTRIGNIFKTIATMFREAFGFARGAKGAAGGIIGTLRTALATFKEGALIKRIGGIFNTISRMFREALGLGRGARAAVGGVLGTLRTALTAFKKGSLITRISGIFTSIATVFREAFGFAKGGGRAVGGVLGKLAKAAATFMKGSLLTRIGNVFKAIATTFRSAFGFAVGGAKGAMVVGGVLGTLAKSAATFIKGGAGSLLGRLGGIFNAIGRIIGGAIGIAGKGAKGVVAAGSFLGKLTSAAAGFLKTPLVTGIKALFTGISGALSGVVGFLRGSGAAVGAVARMGGASVAGAAKVSMGIMGGLQSVVSTISKFTGITKLMKFFATFGTKVLGKLLWPLNIIFAVIGFIKGFRQEKNWEGEPASMKDKILMGIEGAINEVIMIPLNMIKDLTGWLMDKMGMGIKGTGEFDPEGEEIMEKAGWRKAIDDFSFVELWQGLFRTYVAIWEGVIAWFGTLVKDPGKAFEQVWEGSKDVGKWLYENTIKGLIDWLVGFWPSDWGALAAQGFSKIPGGTALYNMITGANRKAEIEAELAAKRGERDVLTGYFDESGKWVKGKETQEERTGFNLGSLADKLTNQYTQEELDADVKNLDDDILKLLEEQKTLNQAALEEKSIYTHDVHLEKLLAPLPVQMGALLRAYGVGQVGRQGMTVNNVTVAPQTSTSTSQMNISENTYGTVDPYTNAAGAYG